MDGQLWAARAASALATGPARGSRTRVERDKDTTVYNAANLCARHLGKLYSATRGQGPAWRKAVTAFAAILMMAGLGLGEMVGDMVEASPQVFELGAWGDGLGQSE